MRRNRQQTIAAANELYDIASRLNQQFANVINTMMDAGDPAERYAPFINAHTAQTQTLTKLLYMIGTWEETWSA